MLNSKFVSLKENEQKIIFSLYPNPADEYLRISLNGKLNFNELYAIKIFDNVGRLVRNEQSTLSYTWPLDKVNSGTYLIQLKSKGNLTKSVVVIK